MGAKIKSLETKKLKDWRIRTEWERKDWKVAVEEIRRAYWEVKRRDW